MCVCLCLKNCPKDDANIIVVASLKERFSNSDLQKILDWAGGHPWARPILQVTVWMAMNVLRQLEAWNVTTVPRIMKTMTLDRDVES